MTPLNLKILMFLLNRLSQKTLYYLKNLSIQMILMTH
jgi:hypothetical protein